MSVKERRDRKVQGTPRKRTGGFPGILGASTLLKASLRHLDSVLRSEAPALALLGETGTGKTLMARALHERSFRHCSPLLFFPTAALPPHLLEGQLFGFPGGAPGLLELAGVGTLVLEDADALSPGLQDRLAEWLLPRDPERTNRGEGPTEDPVPDGPLLVLTARQGPVTREEPLEDSRGLPFGPALAEVVQGRRIHLPPLRRREGDVERLARHFLSTAAHQRGDPPVSIEGKALETLGRYPWPGNVRELREVMERADELAPGTQVRREHLRIRSRTTRPLWTQDSADAAEMILVPPEGKALEEIEAEAVRATLAITSGNRSQAARILGVSRPTLTRKIRKYRLNGMP